MANRWGTVETVADFIFLGSKITADGDCSHEIKRHLLFERKAMNNLDNILKSRDITLPTKICLVKAMVFPLVMYECENWTIKKAQPWRTDVFEVCCWGRILRVLWTARRWNLSMLKEISPEYSWKDWCWSWNSNTLAIWCKEVTLCKRPWCWKRFKAGGEEDDRMRWLDAITDLMDMSLSKLWDCVWWTWDWASSVMDGEAWRAAIHGITKNWTRLSEWTENQRFTCFLPFKQQLHIVSDLFVFLLTVNSKKLGTIFYPSF